MQGPGFRGWLKRFFVPHEGNAFRPKVIRASTLAAVLALVILLQAAYTLDTVVIQKRSDFLASVLPGVLTALTNSDREALGARELAEDALLKKAAQLKADDMAAKGYFSHVTPDGKQPWYWLEQVGYDYEYAGENLAVDFDDSEAVEEAWMNSPTHRANIVKPEYTKIGIAVAKGTYKGEEATFVVQFFASPSQIEAATIPVFAKTPEVPVAKPKLAIDSTSTPATTVAVNEATSAPQVLGTESAPPEAPTFVERIAASPLQTATYALGALALLALIMLIISFFAHLRAPYLEGMGAAFAILVLAVGALTFNAGASSRIELPADTQSASVVNAFHFR